MSTLSLNRKPKLLEYFNSCNLDIGKFFLIDVGASGGIEDFWFVFGDRLKAIGFDPLVAEVKRLNKENTNKNVRYIDAFITNMKNKGLLKNKRSIIASNLFSRSSAVIATKLKKYNYVQEQFNAGKRVIYSKNKITIDEYVREHPNEFIDFIKIDTDGYDFDVLKGADKTLDNQVLGLSVEAQFHGSSDSDANTFSNIDQFLRKKGFYLFDLDVFKYSRGVLPSPFYYDLFGQTKTGQVYWGEAVYFRDLADPQYEETFDFKIEKEKILKLAFLYELFGLPDCAAELIIKRFKQYGLEPYIGTSLDILTPSLRGKEVTYQEYMEAFNKDPESFFPSQVSPPVGEFKEEDKKVTLFQKAIKKIFR